MGTFQAAIAFFISEEEFMVMILLKEFDLLSDIFESCQSFDQLYIIFFCNGSCHFSGNDSCYNCTVFRKHAKFFSLGKKVFQDQHSGHISCETFILAGFLILCINSKSVCIRVSSQNDICVHFCCKFQGQCKCVLIFRVRIAYCGEISVRNFLLFYYINIVKSKFFQYTSYRNIACTMKRSINNFQIALFFIKRLLFNLCKKSVKLVFAYVIYKLTFFKKRN